MNQQDQDFLEELLTSVHEVYHDWIKRLLIDENQQSLEQQHKAIYITWLLCVDPEEQAELHRELTDLRLRWLRQANSSKDRLIGTLTARETFLRSCFLAGQFRDAAEYVEQP